MAEHGVVKYDIGSDGCLTGVYTNEAVHGEILNEIAKKISGAKNTLSGQYDCFFFEGPNDGYRATLAIQQLSSHNVYNLTWTLQGTTSPSHRGVGYILEPHILIARYWAT